MVIYSDVEDRPIQFQSGRVETGSIMQHQLEAAAMFSIVPKDKVVEFDLIFYNPDSEVVLLKAQKVDSCKLIESVYLTSKIRVVKVSSSQFQCCLSISNVYFKSPSRLSCVCDLLCKCSSHWPSTHSHANGWAYSYSLQTRHLSMILS